MKVGNCNQITLEYLHAMIQKITTIQAIKYMLVGASSAIIDIGFLFVLVEYVRLPLLLAATCAFAVAVGNGFFWNKRWTFQDKSGLILRQSAKFLLTALVGLGITLFLLWVFVYGFGLWYLLAKIIVTVIVFFWNFTLNRFWTFRDTTIPRPPDPSPASCDLSIVIPAYNEEHEIVSTVRACVAYCAQRGMRAEIIVVDDGSTDTTAQRVKALSLPIVKLISRASNRGKGASVREGMLTSRGTHALFMDADLATPIEELDRFLPLIHNGADIVIGSRYLKESAIIRKQPWYRALLGRVGNLVIQLVLLEHISDTQCGFKLFTREAARALFSKQKIDGWGFDTEILALAQHMGFSIKEMPVRWHDSTARKSRFRPIKDAHRTLRELVIIKYNILTKRYHH